MARGGRTRRPRILLVDDHPLWRSTVREILEQRALGKVVAECSEGETVVAQAERSKPDLVVMDMGLPGLDGAAATRALVEHRPEVKVLVLSASDLRSDIVDAVRAGASGYLLKTAGRAEIAEAVERVLAGETVIPPELADALIDEVRAPSARRTAHRIVVADPSGIVRESLASLLAGLGFEVVGQASDTRGAVELTDEHDADVVVLDVRLPSDDGHPALVLRERFPDVAVLVLASEPDARPAVTLLADAPSKVGYLLRDRVRDGAELADVIERLVRGEVVIDHDVVNGLVGPRKAKTMLDALTPREREVLGLMAEGHSNQAIMDELVLTAKTVEAHVRSIFTKLGLEPTSEQHRRVRAVLTYLESI